MLYLPCLVSVSIIQVVVVVSLLFLLCLAALFIDMLAGLFSCRHTISDICCILTCLISSLLRNLRESGWRDRLKGSGRPHTLRGCDNISAMEEQAYSQESKLYMYRSTRRTF